MVKSPQKKGNDLERAIALIENAILKAVPTLTDKSYQIYSKKIIIVNGVKHEIDIWIEFDVGGGYKSIFIFEAKNWNKTIGKNEPIIFSEKIKAAKAQQGFLVGKKFSRYAKAAAKQDPRIVLLEVNDAFPVSDAIGNFINRFHCMHVNRNKMHVEVGLTVEASPSVPPSVNIKTATTTLNGIIVDIEKYAIDSAYNIVEKHNDKIPTHTFADGIYQYDLSEEILFDKDKLLIDGIEIRKIVLRIHYQIEIIRPPITSQYEVTTRGRVYNLEAVSAEGLTTQISLIEIQK